MTGGAARESGAPRSSAWLLFRVHPRAAFTVIGLTAGGTLAFCAYSTYMQNYLANTAGFSRETATTISALALLVYLVLQPADEGSRSERAATARRRLRQCCPNWGLPQRECYPADNLNSKTEPRCLPRGSRDVGRDVGWVKRRGGEDGAAGPRGQRTGLRGRQEL